MSILKNKKRTKYPGTLAIVGSGLNVFAHLTAEAESIIRNSDHVFYAPTDPVSASYIRSLNWSGESLMNFYKEGMSRRITYQKTIDAVLKKLQSPLRVCAVFYGHPGVFVYPGHKLVRLSRQLGFEATMYPAVSAEDCLFADLGMDPALGTQSFEATDFLIRKRHFSTRSHLILWQAGLTGEFRYRGRKANRHGLSVLRDYLLAHYTRHHMVKVYVASFLSIWDAHVQEVRLTDLLEAEWKTYSTLVVPPIERERFDSEMIKKLKIPKSQLRA